MEAKRIVSLKRIAKLYEVVERMRSIALKQASVAVSEAESAVSAQRAIAIAARDAGREALESGDRAEWMLTTTQGYVASIRMKKVEGLRVARATAKDEALAEFLASRVQTEQMEQVVDTMAQRVELEETRRVQAVADDRHLARLRWQTMRDGRG